MKKVIIICTGLILVAIGFVYFEFVQEKKHYTPGVLNLVDSGYLKLADIKNHTINEFWYFADQTDTTINYFIEQHWKVYDSTKKVERDSVAFPIANPKYILSKISLINRKQNPK